jgi:hypothetical protein
MSDVVTHREPHPDGTAQGRDPRRMSAADLTACGIERQSRGDAIRSKCLDCMCGNSAEVRRCALADCALWPFRLGGDPWREKREMNDDQRAALVDRLAGARAKRTSSATQA